MRLRGWRYLAACVGAALVALAGNPAASQDQNSPRELCSATGKDWDSTIQACTRALQEEIRASARRRAIALTYRGLAWRNKGDLERAISDITDAISADSAFSGAYVERGDTYSAKGQCDQAIADYDQAIRLVPDDPATYVSRGLCRAAKGEADSAAADFDQAVKVDADDAKGVALLALNLKAALHARAGELDRVVADYDEAIRLAPQRASLFVDRGYARSSKGDYDGAIGDYDQAIKLDANLAAAYFNRGNAHRLKGNEDRAIADYDQAIKLDPDNKAGIALTASTLKANLRSIKGDLDRAVADYGEAIRLAPQNAALLVDRGYAYNRKGDYEHALTDFDQAIKLDSKSAAAYLNRGNVLRAKGEFPRAIADYDQAIALQGDNASAYGARGLVHFYLNDFKKAADDLAHAAAGQPDAYGALLLYLARAHGKKREATAELSKIAERLNKAEWPYPLVELFLERKPLKAVEAAANTPAEHCEAQYYIGEWQLLRGERNAAGKALLAAAENCPKDFIEARGAAEELKRLKR